MLTHNTHYPTCFSVPLEWNFALKPTKSFTVRSDCSEAWVYFFESDGRYWFNLILFYNGCPISRHNSIAFVSSRNRSCAFNAFLKSNKWQVVK